MSDVVVPKIEDLANVDHEGDTVSEHLADLSSFAERFNYMIDRRRLSTIDEDLDSPNVTLATMNMESNKPHVKFMFEKIDEVAQTQSDIKSSKDNMDSEEEVPNSSKFTDPIFV